MAGVALGLLSVAPAILSGVTSVVHSVEKIFGHGQGQNKKEAAMAMSGDLLNIFATVAPTFGLTGAGTSDVQAALSNLIDAIVKFNNATGIFVKSQKP